MAYVGQAGLQRKTLQELRTEIEQALKGVFGVSFETSVDSPNGLLISQMALSLVNIWELAQEVYISRDPAQAQGVALDWAAALNGLSRKVATVCKVQAMVYTDKASATIPAGSIAMRTRGSLRFSLDSAVSISRSLCKELLISDDGSSKNTDYTFHFTFGDVTLNNTTSQSNLQSLSTLVISAGGYTEMTSRGLRVYMYDGSQVGITGSMPDDFIIQAGALGDFTAETAGAQTCEVGELDAIPVAVTGWSSVYNYTAGVPGSDMETDEELRARRAAAVKVIQARGTDPSIRAHLLQDVDGVTAAKVVSNRGMVEDSAGRPPKCFECLVVGGSDEDVAKCIWQNQPAGIQPYGNTSVEITDDSGDSQVISFSRTQAKYLWVKVTYSLYTEESAPTDAEIRAAIMQWSQAEYQMGVDVIPTRVLQGLYSGTTGIGTASIQVAVTDAAEDEPTYGTSIIPIDPSDYAVLATSRIALVRT